MPIESKRKTEMLSLVAILAASLVIPVAVSPFASAQPPAVPGPPPDTGAVASSPPGIVTTPDGWVLSVQGGNESQLPVAPLTTATSSREYLVGGTFGGTVTGEGSTSLSGGILEVGYQIGCGIELNQVRLIGQAGIGTSGSSLTNVIPTGVTFPVSGKIEIHPKPGTVATVTVDKKEYKAAPVRVTLKDIHVKVDGCVGQSFLRSYATLTSSTADTDDVVAYYGVTKSV
jgi:hypothetical protein